VKLVDFGFAKRVKDRKSQLSKPTGYIVVQMCQVGGISATRFHYFEEAIEAIELILRIKEKRIHYVVRQNILPRKSYNHSDIQQLLIGGPWAFWSMNFLQATLRSGTVRTQFTSLIHCPVLKYL
jgi:hypothetical protein